MAENSEVGLEDRFISSLDAVKTALAPYSYRDHDQKLGSKSTNWFGLKKMPLLNLNRRNSFRQLYAMKPSYNLF